MQQVEGIIDEMHAALAVRRCLRMRKARQSSIVDAAEFAVEIGRLHVYVGEHCGGAWIFGSPIEPGPGEKLNSAIVNSRGHTVAVELYLMHPLRP
jgi:hypothetical protein